MRKTSTKNLTLSGILAAVGFVILSLSVLFPTLDLTLAALAGIVVVIAVIEAGGAYPYLIFAVVSVLSLLLLPYRFAAAVFVSFAGWYPILKAELERLHPYVGWVVKLSAFNVFLALFILLAGKVFGVEDPLLTFNPLIIIVCNGAFVLYDIALTGMITFYLMKLRKSLGLGGFFDVK